MPLQGHGPDEPAANDAAVETVAVSKEAAAPAAVADNGPVAVKAVARAGTCMAALAGVTRSAASVARQACVAISALMARVSNVFDSTLGFPGEGPPKRFVRLRFVHCS